LKLIFIDKQIIIAYDYQLYTFYIDFIFYF